MNATYENGWTPLYFCTQIRRYPLILCPKSENNISRYMSHGNILEVLQFLFIVA